MPRVVFLPITATTWQAFKFCNSPFVRVADGLREFSIAGQAPNPDQVQGVLERCGRELSANWDNLYRTVFCLVTPDSSLRELLDGGFEGFERAANEFRKGFSDQDMRELILIAYSWLGICLKRTDEAPKE